MARPRKGHIAEDRRKAGRYTLRFVDQNGKRRSESLGEVPLDVAKERLREVLAEVEAGKWRSRKDAEVEEWERRSGARELRELEEWGMRTLHEVKSYRAAIRRYGVHASERQGNIAAARGHRTIAEPIQRMFRQLRRSQPNLQSAAERTVWKEYTRRGWELLRNGWPDFLAITPGGGIVAIEVKGPGDQIRPDQANMIALLREVGIDTHLVRVHGSHMVRWNDGAPDPESDEGRAADLALLDAYLAESHA